MGHRAASRFAQRAARNHTAAALMAYAFVRPSTREKPVIKAAVQAVHCRVQDTEFAAPELAFAIMDGRVTIAQQIAPQIRLCSSVRANSVVGKIMVGVPMVT